MYFSTVLSAGIAALALSSTTTALPAADSTKLQKRCVFNDLVTSTWSEDGLTRYRLNFSGDFDNIQNVCDYWGQANNNCGAIQNNVQCYYNDEVQSWVIEDNEVAGPAGASVMDCMTINLRNIVTQATGCTTG